MAYLTSTSITSSDNLIDALANFAAANGWTVVRNNVVGSVRTTTLRKAGVTDYVHFLTAGSEVILRASVGYDAEQPATSQPDQTPYNCICNNLAGPYPRVWFFANGDEIHVVIRRSDTTGAYAHMAFGRLTKYGTFTGGTYIDASYFSQATFNSGTWDGNDHALFGYGPTNYGFIRVDADGAVNSWKEMYQTVGGSVANAVLSGMGPLNAASLYSQNMDGTTYETGRFVNATDDNVFSGRSFLHMIEYHVRRSGSPTYFSPIGYIDNTRMVSLAKFDPEQEISVATEDWVVFPVVRKAAQSSTPGAPNASDNNGYAIRKVA